MGKIKGWKLDKRFKIKTYTSIKGRSIWTEKGMGRKADYRVHIEKDNHIWNIPTKQEASMKMMKYMRAHPNG